MKFIKTYQIFEAKQRIHKIIPLEEVTASKYYGEVISLVGEFKVTEGGRRIALIAIRNYGLFDSVKIAIRYSLPSTGGDMGWELIKVESGKGEFILYIYKTPEECLKSILTIILAGLNTNISREKSNNFFLGKEQDRLTEENFDLFFGHGYSMDQIKFLLTNLKEIASGEIGHGLMSAIRKEYPDLWQEVLKKIDPEGAGVSADLGELGF